MTIYLGADHAGWEVKEAVEAWLKDEGHNVVDMGNEHLVEHDDYPEFSHAVAKRVQADPGSLGIVACGNAQGVCIVANKVKGVRAATGFSAYAAESSRTDDNANVLCLPGRAVEMEEAKEIVRVWLQTAFSGAERHKRRLEKVAEIEEEEFGV
ncbi:TPA: ribose-5-phosphate isomerase [Candidatus Uhrbacteria bacterium]|nr:MAG: hypothetical protein A3D69_00550 [Candidatus Uhrbacteria bacterium RIFCSPHIGHO2_02_FULL_54_11]HBL39365.1 ribose-5-phosphate isomerase [Candidatus Uhrbacteria bacterium]